MKRLSLFGGLVSLVAMGMFFIPVTASAIGTKVKPNYIKYNNNKYRRAGAESVTLGAVGSKKVRITKVAYFDKHSNWKGKKPKIEIGIPVRISSQQITQLQGSAAAIIDARGSTASLNINSNTNYEANINIVKMKFVDNGTIIKLINKKSKSARKTIKKIPHGRIITSVLVLISGEESSTSSFTGSATLADTVGNNGSITVRQDNGTTVTFGSGSIVGYEYHKMKWKTGRKVLKKLVRYGVML